MIVVSLQHSLVFIVFSLLGWRFIALMASLCMYLPQCILNH